MLHPIKLSVVFFAIFYDMIPVVSGDHECNSLDLSREKWFIQCTNKLNAGNISKSYCYCWGASCFLRRCYQNAKVVIEERGCLKPKPTAFIKQSGSNCVMDYFGDECVMCICDNGNNCNAAIDIKETNYTTTCTTIGTTTTSAPISEWSFSGPLPVLHHLALFIALLSLFI